MKSTSLILKPPSLNEQDRSFKLTALIKNQIQINGPIAFENFMEQALFAPQLGYYENAHPFGEEGDFITAAHCGPWLSRMLAKQFMQISKSIVSFDICEFGAGDAVMALEILLSLERSHCLPNHYYIIEKSKRLQSIQYETFKSHPSILKRVSWIGEIPKNFNGIIFANEVLDAMPFNIFKKNHHDAYDECFVDIVDNELQMTWLPARHSIPPSIIDIHLNQGHCFEINPHLQGFLDTIYLACDQAVCLLLDYGMHERAYFSRSEKGYARAFYKHRVHDELLRWPGLQDLTTHVNFTEVASIAYSIGWDIMGYTTQANFLGDCGISEVELAPHDEPEGILSRAEIKKLILPQDMGELFKLLALGKNTPIDLLGFQHEMSNRL
jgi:SAM-dependent MidA family methyltransferase